MDTSLWSSRLTTFYWIWIKAQTRQRQLQWRRQRRALVVNSIHRKDQWRAFRIHHSTGQVLYYPPLSPILFRLPLRLWSMRKVTPQLISTGRQLFLMRPLERLSPLWPAVEWKKKDCEKRGTTRPWWWRVVVVTRRDFSGSTGKLLPSASENFFFEFCVQENAQPSFKCNLFFSSPAKHVFGSIEMCKGTGAFLYTLYVSSVYLKEKKEKKNLSLLLDRWWLQLSWGSIPLDF